MSKLNIIACILLFISVPKAFSQLNANLLGNAENQGDNCYLITPNLNNQYGAIWYENVIDFSTDFEIVFDAYFGTNDADGADGMALVFKTNATPELGGLGGELGYGGIASSLAVEFDTWQNQELNDPIDDHIGLMINGISNHNSGLALAEFPNLENGMTHEIKFSWNASAQKLTINKDCVQIIAYVGDIVNLALNGNSNAYFGFTGSTGGAKNEQRICFKYISFVESIQDQNLCKGDTLNTIDATFSGATSYSWTPTNDISNPSIPNPLFSPTTTTTYEVTITENCGNIYTESFTITVHDNPLAFAPTDIITCEINSGMALFDLTAKDDEIRNGQNGVTVSYYATQVDADTRNAALVSPYETGSTTIFARVENDEISSCAAFTSLNLIVNPSPDFSIETPQIVCSSDPTFTIVLDPLEGNPSEIYMYEWKDENGLLLSNNSTLSVSTSGIYFVTLTKTDGTSCSKTKKVFVNNSELATITQDDITITDISNNNTITISESHLGLGDYEYALDDAFSFYQDEPFFDYVNGGIHTLYVRDKNGCGTASFEMSVVNYPKFFTPNGDGYHDFWQIEGVNSDFQPSSDIYIFNRYGKLLKQLDPTSSGWNGTFNGVLLSNDDYWFRVLLEDGREFIGHFTLKR